MSEKNELNDIILNKGSSVGINKKIILAVATLVVILIVVIMLVSTLTPDADDSLPQPVPPAQEEIQAVQTPQNEPIFEEVEVVKEDEQSNENLDNIAQRVKQESLEEKQVSEPKELKKEEVVVIAKPEPIVKNVPTVKREISKQISTSGKYYVQVGSFSRYAPDEKFLSSITKQGYKYKFHKVTNNSRTLNKVLVGPFDTKEDSKEALVVIRKNIEAGAFLIKL